MFGMTTPCSCRARVLLPSCHAGKPLWIPPDGCRGVALEALGRFDDAISDYRAVLAAAPEDPSAWNNLGNAYAGGLEGTTHVVRCFNSSVGGWLAGSPVGVQSWLLGESTASQLPATHSLAIGRCCRKGRLGGGSGVLRQGHAAGASVFVCAGRPPSVLAGGSVCLMHLLPWRQGKPTREAAWTANSCC